MARRAAELGRPEDRKSLGDGDGAWDLKITSEDVERIMIVYLISSASVICARVVQQGIAFFALELVTRIRASFACLNLKLMQTRRFSTSIEKHSLIIRKKRQESRFFSSLIGYKMDQAAKLPVNRKVNMPNTMKNEETSVIHELEMKILKEFVLTKARTRGGFTISLQSKCRILAILTANFLGEGHKRPWLGYQQSLQKKRKCEEVAGSREDVTRGGLRLNFEYLIVNGTCQKNGYQMKLDHGKIPFHATLIPANFYHGAKCHDCFDSPFTLSSIQHLKRMLQDPGLKVKATNSTKNVARGFVFPAYDQSSGSSARNQALGSGAETDPLQLRRVRRIDPCISHSELFHAAALSVDCRRTRLNPAHRSLRPGSTDLNSNGNQLSHKVFSDIGVGLETNTTLPSFGRFPFWEPFHSRLGSTVAWGEGWRGFYRRGLVREVGDFSGGGFEAAKLHIILLSQNGVYLCHSWNLRDRFLPVHHRSFPSNLIYSSCKASPHSISKFCAGGNAASFYHGRVAKQTQVHSTISHIRLVLEHVPILAFICHGPLNENLVHAYAWARHVLTTLVHTMQTHFMGRAKLVRAPLQASPMVADIVGWDWPPIRILISGTWSCVVQGLGQGVCIESAYSFQHSQPPQCPKHLAVDSPTRNASKSRPLEILDGHDKLSHSIPAYLRAQYLPPISSNAYGAFGERRTTSEDPRTDSSWARD
ncbi:uncharacterized protein BDR25DRAFT_347877 [Lindgomyces ingoldianus]|uniref:Uncharacterized protein n=1 Tax=Lindgomyces ingoldianus TaxID=673940 RepID=A0ACB6REQ3_9PLEO|nr:uncharacterized protein BDR25DRAFT_347877 [Lindgomyces ingoldianus]KAF2477525.1 hypothetical protein BDR25DRAFT_347877 [Lindgomyces ingoldianus]